MMVNSVFDDESHGWRNDNNRKRFMLRQPGSPGAFQTERAIEIERHGAISSKDHLQVQYIVTLGSHAVHTCSYGGAPQQSI